MMTLQVGCIQPNNHLNFSLLTLLIINVTYNVHHRYKSSNLLQMEGSKRHKYPEHYQQQRYAFAPMVTKS